VTDHHPDNLPDNPPDTQQRPPEADPTVPRKLPDGTTVATGAIEKKAPDRLRTTHQLFEVTGEADDDTFICRQCGFEGTPKLARVAHRQTPNDIETSGSARERICPKCWTAQFEMYH